MYFLEAKGEERKIEAASWMKKMTEYLGKLKKLITKNIANTVDVVFFFFRMEQLFRRLLWY